MSNYPPLASQEKHKKSALPETGREESLGLQKEAAAEQALEATEKSSQPPEKTSTDANLPSNQPISPLAQAGVASPAKTQELRIIEEVLAEDMAEVYLNLDEAHRRLFKEEGERASRQIKTLFDKAQATARKILEIIKRWLMLIPHVNKFFLEQEAKIKTDKIMRLEEQLKKNKQ